MAGLRQISKLGKIGPRSPAGATPNPPPPPPGPRPLPDLGMPVQAPRGPMHLRLGQKRKTTGGPGQMPADFPGSQPEFVWYVASAWYHKDPKDPRRGPWLGGELWLFQAPENPDAPREAGGSVTDFVYLTPGGGNILVRIEGTYFHLEQGGAQSARDAYLIAQAGHAIDRVVRINDTQFMADVSGQTAIRLLADVLAGRTPVGQAQGGTVLPPRYADFETGIYA